MFPNVQIDGVEWKSAGGGGEAAGGAAEDGQHGEAFGAAGARDRWVVCLQYPTSPAI